MFAARYFGPRYFAPRYFPRNGGAVVVVPEEIIRLNLYIDQSRSKTMALVRRSILDLELERGRVLVMSLERTRTMNLDITKRATEFNLER